MKIYFARHGESQANVLHEISNRGLRHGLTRKGREQAAALAHKLQDLNITHIYASPVLRAIETCVIVANRLDVDYTVVEALREYDCGIAEGRADEEGWQLWKTLFDDWTLHKRWERRIPEGECFHDLQARFVPFIEHLINHYGATDANLLCLAHGGLYCMMLPLVLRNVDQATVLELGFAYAACIVAEARPEGLICIEWNGSKL
ncbi:MAG: histidine phosphatase family protein [Caldilineaceae bacterium]